MLIDEAVYVEAYAGASYPERPTTVRYKNQRLEVEQVIRSWRTPDALHFLVELETLGRATLSYRYQADAWSLSQTSHYYTRA